VAAAVPPFLLKTYDNPEGVDGSVFEGIQKAIVADRYAFFTEFFKNFYNADLLLGKRVSEQAIQSNWNVACGASATACLACVPTWHEDFRRLTGIDVPTLVMQGDADRILPMTASGLRIAKLIKGSRLVVVKDGPHCITWTHAAEVNSELVNFIGKGLAKHGSARAYCHAYGLRKGRSGGCGQCGPVKVLEFCFDIGPGGLRFRLTFGHTHLDSTGAGQICENEAPMNQ